MLLYIHAKGQSVGPDLHRVHHGMTFKVEHLSKFEAIFEKVLG
jgi:hypothetical protein